MKLRLNKKNGLVKKFVCYTTSIALIGGCTIILCKPVISEPKKEPEVISNIMPNEDNSKTMEERLVEHMDHITLSEHVNYMLEGYYNGDNVEYLFQNGKYSNDTCEGFHKYYYRYLVDEQKFEPVGFTCSGSLEYHQGENNTMIESYQLFGSTMEISTEGLKRGDASRDDVKERLMVSREEQLQRATFPLVDKNNRALCVVEMTPKSGEEAIYFVGYPRSQDNVAMNISFYDVLEMKTRSFSYEEYDIDYNGLFGWDLEGSTMDQKLTYQQVIEIKNYIHEAQTLLSPTTPKIKTFDI